MQVKRGTLLSILRRSLVEVEVHYVEICLVGACVVDISHWLLVVQVYRYILRVFRQMSLELVNEVLLGDGVQLLCEIEVDFLPSVASALTAMVTLRLM